jgi:hypothetical protein
LLSRPFFSSLFGGIYVRKAPFGQLHPVVLICFDQSLPASWGKSVQPVMG